MTHRAMLAELIPMTESQPPASSAPPDLDAGQAALARGDWEAARDAFQTVLAGREDAAALEGLGQAAWWLDLTATVFDARERAYRLYRERGDAVSAARVAVWLGWDYASFRGEGAVARGWLGLARQLLESRHDTLEYAWLSVREGVLELFEEGDTDGARHHASEAIEAARAVGSRDFELLGHAVEGAAQVSAGQVVEGMRRLDGVSAAIIAGDVTDRLAIGLSGCYLIAACERVRDYDRAAQWTKRIKAYSARWGLRPLFAVCRTQYAAVCMWHGNWDEAERELEAAVQELSESRPAMTAEGAVRLGELRRLQGRVDEAHALFDRAEGHPLATVGRAALALDGGDSVSAAELAERYLRGVLPNNRTERVRALEILVRARLGAGRTKDAHTAADELAEIANAAGTLPMRAAAGLCHGLVAAASGDLESARRQHEDALDLFHRSGATLEAARARLELASVLNKAGRVDAAAAEVQRAVTQLSKITARLELARAERQLEEIRGHAPAEAADTAGLTRRELDVLRLIAKGLSNQRVGEQLFISEHTVHRHVANTLSKLGVPSRSAAVAEAGRRGLLKD
jgi:ATP/maltotriose-dependent transcriptional regulator MalT